MKRLLPFLLRLIVISLLFLPVLSPLHSAYKFVVRGLSNAALPAGMSVVELPYDGSGYLYTFLILILGVPGLSVKKRIIGVITGICLFVGADFFMAGVWLGYMKPEKMSLGSMAVEYGYIVFVHYLLPFLLWLAFAFREIEGLMRGVKLNHLG